MSKKGPGHPSVSERYGEETTRLNIIIPVSHKNHLIRRYGSIARGIRHLIDLDMKTSDEGKLESEVSQKQ